MTIDILTYMRPFLKVKALNAAFDCGLADLLLKGRGAARPGLAGRLKLKERGAELLLRVLASYGVVRLAGGRVLPGAAFKKDMAANPALVRNLTAYMDLAYRDLQAFPQLLKTGVPAGGIKEFFEYRAGKEASARINAHLSSFTRNFVELIGKKYNFGRHPYVLDVGGNDGEFLAGLCRLYPGLKGGVVDLPGPCAIGLRKFKALVKRGRLEFFPGNFFAGPLPVKAGLIVFKGVLNDWPDRNAAGLLSRAYAALPPGGKLLVIERLDGGALRTADDCLFDLAFMQLIAPGQDFRSLPRYRKLLREAGFTGTRLRGRLPAGFCIIECERPRRKAA